MRRKLDYIFLGIIVFLIMYSVTLTFRYSEIQDSKQVEVVRVYQNNIDKTKLVEYVIKHSGNRLSDRMAEELVDSALATKYPLLILAIGKVESNYNTMAYSRAGAIGMFQIRYSVWGKKLKEHGIIKNRRDLFDYRISVRACEFVLNEMYSKTGDLSRALMKYVGSRHTRYVTKVLSSLGDLYVQSRVFSKENQTGGDNKENKKENASTDKENTQ